MRNILKTRTVFTVIATAVVCGILSFTPASSAYKVGDSVADVETDKATLPLESYYAGVVLYVAAKKGDSLKIGDLIAVVGKAGEDYSALLTAPAAPKAESKKDFMELIKRNVPVDVFQKECYSSK